MCNGTHFSRCDRKFLKYYPKCSHNKVKKKILSLLSPTLEPINKSAAQVRSRDGRKLRRKSLKS